MPTPPKPWNCPEEDTLLDFLIEHVSEAGDNGSFKKPTYEKAVLAIAPFRSKGEPKTFSSCQNKYGALRKTYRVVYKIQNLSGVTWSDETGASIGPNEASMWADYIAKNPLAKPFRNEGWRHRAKFALLMPSPNSTVNVFHGTQASVDVPDFSQSPGPIDTPFDAPTPPTAGADEGVAAEESDNEEPATVISSASRKRQREPATPTPRAKRVRQSAGAAAISDMVTSIDRFGERIAAALTATPSNAPIPTPVRRTNAVTAARKLEGGWLNRPQLLALLAIFSSDKASCDMYLSFIDDDELRMDWVAQQINLPSPLIPIS